MKLLMMLTFMMGAFGATAFASELDRDEGVVNAGRELTGTTVLRVNEKTGEVAVLKSNKALGSEDEAQELIARGSFSPVDASRNRDELDTDAGSSSWYFYYRPHYGYGYQSYYHYGSWYTPYYQFTYNQYSYYYYGQCNRYGHYGRGGYGRGGYGRGYHRGSRCW